MGSRTASLVAVVILVAAIVTLVFRHALFATHPAGIAAHALAVLLMIWARLTLKWCSFQPLADPTRGDLITTGPYRFVRHPIHAAIFYLLVAGIVFHIGLVNVLAVVLAFVALAERIKSEEHLLTGQYPEYVAYAARTKRIIPFVL